MAKSTARMLKSVHAHPHTHICIRMYVHAAMLCRRRISNRILYYIAMGYPILLIRNGDSDTKPL